MSLIPKQFWKDIEPFETKVVLVSGGRDSTYIALEFWKRKIRCHYLFNDTGLSMKSSRDTLDRLYELTKENVIKFHKSKASDHCNVKEVLDSSFEKIDFIIKAKENEGKYLRNYLYCCNKLKKKPMTDYCKNNFNSETTVLIRGDSPKENQQRFYRLSELKTKNTFIKFIKTYGFYYGFPLRDLRIEVEITELENVVSSGCSICPVLLIFRMYKKDLKSYIKTKKYFLKNFQNAQFCSKLDQTLDEFFPDYIYCNYCGEEHKEGKCLIKEVEV